jgi:hypothetical protein
VKGVGKRKRGKPQLRIDEARKFIAEAKRMADAGDIAGVVGLGALCFGTRITELVSRPVRELDDDGRLLWISKSKTARPGEADLPSGGDPGGLSARLARASPGSVAPRVT